jgi:ABC-type transport system substrate-binding protein
VIPQQIAHPRLEKKLPPLFTWGWIADYPDPDNFLRNTWLYDLLQRAGWHNERFEQLVEEGAHTTNRVKRMALYREADRIWVAEDVVVCALSYGVTNRFEQLNLVKPWVKGYRPSQLRHVLYKNVTIEPH